LLLVIVIIIFVVAVVVVVVVGGGYDETLFRITAHSCGVKKVQKDEKRRKE
jgi:CDP-diacylglycerol pyrophosphatase